MQLATVFLLLCSSPLPNLGVWGADEDQAVEEAEADNEASSSNGPQDGTANTGEPLYLTPLIDAGQLCQARSSSKVGPIGADYEVPSYAGYITVNPQYNSNLFFWFVPSLRDPQNDPVIMWMQGGPGTSSLLGFFNEHGPYYLSEDGNEAAFRELTWAQRYSMIYVDQPVGTGYSYTENDAGYARNQTEVGRDLLEFLQQFFTLFGDLAQNEFYIAGESYAGKYVPTVGAALHENADSMRVKINFRGIAYGNGLTDPINMVDFGDFIYGIGLIDRSAADHMTRVAKEAVDLLRAGRTIESGVIMDTLFFGLLTHNTFFKNVTGFEYYYNYLIDKEPEDSKTYKAFVQKPEIRRALHVGQQGFSMSRDLVAGHFVRDIMRSAVPQFTVVLESGYKVLVYSGPLDICVPTTHTEKFLSNVAWSHADRWSHEPRHIWRSADGKRLYGYKKTVENLNFVVVRNGGHVLPYDQPEAMFALITAFIDDEPPFSGQAISSA
ncbi:venom serine carboxypeptidase-like isoform X2 [Dermacentor silvarum]|nr:venom serine carboxypeptidase-like isoform X2 [Dermacentor silvarum]